MISGETFRVIFFWAKKPIFDQCAGLENWFRTDRNRRWATVMYSLVKIIKLCN